MNNAFFIIIYVLELLRLLFSQLLLQAGDLETLDAISLFFRYDFKSRHLYLGDMSQFVNGFSLIAILNGLNENLTLHVVSPLQGSGTSDVPTGMHLQDTSEAALFGGLWGNGVRSSELHGGGESAHNSFRAFRNVVSGSSPNTHRPAVMKILERCTAVYVDLLLESQPFQISAGEVRTVLQMCGSTSLPVEIASKAPALVSLLSEESFKSLTLIFIEVRRAGTLLICIAVIHLISTT